MCAIRHLGVSNLTSCFGGFDHCPLPTITTQLTNVVHHRLHVTRNYRTGRGELQSSIRLVADDESARHGKCLLLLVLLFFPLSTWTLAHQLKPSQEVGETKNLTGGYLTEHKLLFLSLSSTHRAILSAIVKIYRLFTGGPSKIVPLSRLTWVKSPLLLPVTCHSFYVL